MLGWKELAEKDPWTETEQMLIAATNMLGMFSLRHGGQSLDAVFRDVAVTAEIDVESGRLDVDVPPRKSVPVVMIEHRLFGTGEQRHEASVEAQSENMGEDGERDPSKQPG